jgi:hypothetical protein
MKTAGMKSAEIWTEEDEARGSFIGTDQEWHEYVKKNVCAIQADVLRSVADEMDKDAQEFEKSSDPFKAGQFFALSRTADHYRDASNKLK